MALRGLGFAVAIFGALIEAVPTITFPINSQLPPVARPSVPFQYTFPASTFFSPLPLTYTITGEPSWLSLDSNTRTLSGTPPSNDLGLETVTGVSFSLIATDTTGSTTLNTTLVVSKNPAPAITTPLSTQLASTGVFSAPSTLLYHPSTPFKFSFQPDTFQVNGASSELSYYAITVENTPLPSWILFDAKSLTFSGQTPDYQSLIQPPQTFGVQLVASDVQGFSGPSLSFNIEVGVHLFAFRNAYMIANASAGDSFSFNGLVGNLQLDGQTAPSADIASITADTPSWLSFDNTSLVLSADVPLDVVPYNISIFAKDIYGDTTNATVFIDIESTIFNSSIGILNVAIGSSFSYDLSTYLRRKSDVDMTVQLPSTLSWISFNPENFVLSGKVPANLKPSSADISITATSKSTKKSASQSFKLAEVAPANQPTPSATTTTLSSTPSATAKTVASANATPYSGLSQKKKVLVGIFVPVLVICLILFLGLFCCLKKRRPARNHPYMTPTKAMISAPIQSSTSVLEIVKPVYLVPPKPLELNMSGFMTNSQSAIQQPQRPLSKNEPPPRKLTPPCATKGALRRSQTTSGTSDLMRFSRTLESEQSGMRSRAYSDNVLSNTESTWRSTKGSSNMGLLNSRTNSSKSGSTNPNRLTRNYSNYSRKGHKRRSAMVFSQNPMENLRESRVSSQGRARDRKSSSINWDRVELQSQPEHVPVLDYYSVMNRPRPTKQMQTQPVGLDHPNMQSSVTSRSTRRQSRLMLGRTHSGIGHGGRESISSVSGSGKRRSTGHGQDWTAGNPNMFRDSRTWLTVASNDAREQKRRSASSALSRYSDDLKHAEGYTRLQFIRPVAKSPSVIQPSGTFSDKSTTSKAPRPVSRRMGDSTPFFGGSSISRASRRSAKKMFREKTSYADSPTVPEESIKPSLEETILHGLREESADTGMDTPNRGKRDSFSISYGYALARQGTRELRNYVQGHMEKIGSMKSMESKDSRFESAGGSDLSRSPERRTTGASDGFEDILDEDEDEENWDSYESPRDSQGNLIDYGAGSSPGLLMAAIRPAVKPNFVMGGGRGDGEGEGEGLVDEDVITELSPNAKMMPGKGMRPKSVVAKHRKDSSMAIMGGATPEGDWRAYI